MYILLEDASVKRVSVFVVEDDLAVDGHDVPLDEAVERVRVNYRPRKVGGVTEKAKQTSALKK